MNSVLRLRELDKGEIRRGLVHYVLYILGSDDLCTYGNQFAGAVDWGAYGYAVYAEYRNDIIRLSSWCAGYGFANPNPSPSDILYITPGNSYPEL